MNSIRLVVVLAAFTFPLVAATDDAEFFETKIRPLLVTNCHSCHTGGALGGLRLDSREAILKGGKSGKAVIEGKADESLLMQTVRRTHTRIKMPPIGTLTEAEITSLAEWINRGLPWPESTKQDQLAGVSIISPAQRSFWSYQPVQLSQPGPVKNKSWIRTPVDQYILTSIEKAGLKTAPPADKRTWLRRITIDLTGLPPTPEEADAYVSDNAPNAKEKVVDRLLSSPHYGERWARHWLDLARYSDGQLAADTDTPFPNSWRYRDWVVDAFNNDMPYDRFVKAQIAADLLPEMKDDRAGLGFQALAADSGIHDQVDVTTKAFLGMTVGCAQCHDHKFDPIPTSDYYSLLGIFKSSKVDQYPLVPATEVDRYKNQKKKIDDLKEILNDYLAEQTKELSDLLARDTARYLMAVWKKKTEEPGLDTETLERWTKYLADRDKDHPYLKPWWDVIDNHPTEEQVKQAAEKYQAFVLELLADQKEVEDKNYVAFGGRKGMKDEQTRQYTNIVSLPVLKFYQWRELAHGPYFSDGFKAPAGVLWYGHKNKEIERFLGGIAKSYVDKLRGEIAELEKDMPPMYPFYHSMVDVDKPADVNIALRGDPKTPGDIAPRRFLQILSSGEPEIFKEGSGRAQLAKAIADPKNPLTARVMVNRIWKHHFGKGIVRTPSNFGRMGERPSHPELLDYLADKFIKNGWSIKKIHREILLSNTYGQATGNSVDKDPDNKLLSHFDLVPRLDMEALRDSILSVSGQLDLKVGGASKEVADDNVRRSIYLTVSRTRLDPGLALFDFPDPNISTDERPVTAGPLQGLFWLNSKFVARSADALNQRLIKEAGSDPAKRISRAYSLLYGRPPATEELKLGIEFVSTGAKAWPHYLRTLLGAAEFSSVN